MKTRVGVIFGGRSGEHEISIRSAKTVIENIDSDKYEVVPITIMNDGRWLSPAESVTQFPAPSDDLKGKVIDEIEKGYYLNDKVIRFAKVIVGS